MRLFETFRAYFRKTDPETSALAAESIPVNLLEQVVYNTIKQSSNGMTTDEIEIATNMRPGSITPRIAPLIRKGYIIDTGERRKARSGRTQRVLMAVA